MNKKILQYRGLYGDDQLPYLPDFIHIESLELRSKTYNWEIADHTHSDLFQLFVIRKGGGILISEETEITITGPSIISVPANHLHGFRFHSDIKGEVITLSDSFLDGILKDRPQLILEVIQMNQSLFDPSEQIFEEILFVVAQIQRELIEEPPEKEMGLQSYFQLLFLLLYRKRLQSEEQDLPTTHKTLAYFQNFKKLVKQSLQKPMTIKEYARQLGITQMHLNRVCHAVVQESALKVVQQFIIGEAKKYLLNTSYSISEISYFLNFNDPAYFSRLFKKWVGVSPGEFRKE